MTYQFINYKDNRIAYRITGTGKTIACCFHGYGETGKNFLFLEKYLAPNYRLILIDLPGHGDSFWNNQTPLYPADLLTIISELSATHGFSIINDKIVLVGYSLGGRIALSLYQEMPHQVSKLILLAPDGLKVNPWYWLATRTIIGNRLFAFTMQKPAWFFGLLKGMHKAGMVNPSIFKFVTYYIGDPEVRRQLYTRWTQLRFFRPHIAVIKKKVAEENTQVRLIYGLHDRIIRPGKGENFVRGLENNATLTIIHAGHQLLHEKHIDEILPAFLQ